MKKVRGVFEKVPGSGIWWICYFDADGRKRREKAGRKSAAIQLYRKRKTEVMEGKKLPENFRATAVLFSELAEDVLEYSKTHKLSYAHDCYRMAKLEDTFGDRRAEGITPQDFERRIGNHEACLTWDCVDFERQLLNPFFSNALKCTRVHGGAILPYLPQVEGPCYARTRTDAQRASISSDTTSDTHSNHD